MTLLEGGLYMGNILLHGNDDASRMGGLAKRRVHAAAPAPGSVTWQQTADDLEVTAVLPAGTAKRALKVELSARLMRVRVEPVAQPLVELALYASVRPDEMTYTFDAAKALVTVMVEKTEGAHWPRLEAASDGQIL